MSPASLSNSWFQVSRFVKNHSDTYPFIDPLKGNLAGKSVLITGASKGIGRATAISFVRAGCSKIALAARSPLSEVADELYGEAQLAERPAPQVLTLEMDVTSAESVKKGAQEVEKAFGGTLDILVNNAGRLEDWVPVGDSDPDDWWETWEVSVKGVYLCCRYFLPLLLKSESKTVINVSSAGALNVSPGSSAYQTAKFAMCRYTEFLEAEYGGQGLVAISVRPGGVRTDLSLKMPSKYHSILVDTPELSGDAVAWLCGERREWLSGRFVNGNWDMEEFLAKKQEVVDGDLLRFRMVI